jgi:hypothetical protein
MPLPGDAAMRGDTKRKVEQAKTRLARLTPDEFQRGVKGEVLNTSPISVRERFGQEMKAERYCVRQGYSESQCRQLYEFWQQWNHHDTRQTQQYLSLALLDKAKFITGLKSNEIFQYFMDVFEFWLGVLMEKIFKPHELKLLHRATHAA